jgi:hypothetical protein
MNESNTVNVELQVLALSHPLVAVNITVFVLPHAEGFPVLLLVSTKLQPPVAVADASQVAYFEFILDCV